MPDSTLFAILVIHNSKKSSTAPSHVDRLRCHSESATYRSHLLTVKRQI